MDADDFDAWELCSETGLYLPPPQKSVKVSDQARHARTLIVQAGDDAHWTQLLHIHVEDNNLEDWWFDKENAPFIEDIADNYRDAEQWERDIFDALAACTEDERYYAVTGDTYPASAYRTGE